MAKEIKYFDIHSHLNFAAYDEDREEVIERALQTGVSMISVGTQMDTSRTAVEHAQKHPDIYATVGLHPIHTSKSHHDTQELGEGGREFTSRGEEIDRDRYLELAKNPKVVGIGECGLDYYRLDVETQVKQAKAFESMVDVANEVNKPLMLHVRSGSGKSAYLDAYQILKVRGKVRGNLHFFAGNTEEAKIFLELGYSFSFTGVLTFTHDYDEVVKYIPLERIMSETDCPFITPVPHRGKRNEPAYVVEVVKAIARIKGESEEVVARQLLINTRDFFSI